MKIKLKALGLPKMTGVYYDPLDRDDSATGWKTIGETHTEIYWQADDGEFTGTMLGTHARIWIPKRVITTTPQRDGYYVIDSITYKILAIKSDIYSDFEDHYDLVIKQDNV